MSDRVLLYMHIPKAGGTSLNDWLYRSLKNDSFGADTKFFRYGIFYYPSGYIEPKYSLSAEKCSNVLSDYRLRAVIGHFSYGIHKYIPRSYGYVAVLREPVERVVSLFFFHKLAQAQGINLEGHVISDNMSLREFAEMPPYTEIDNGQVRRISGVSPRIGGCTQDMLELAKRRLEERFDIVGTVEQLPQTIQSIRGRFPMRNNELLFCTNQNPQRPSLDDLCRADIEMISERNSLDIQLYDFVRRELNG